MSTGFENHAGFNITNSKLQVVEIKFEEDKFLLENVDEAYFNQTIDLEKDKETKISALLQGAYDELLIRKHLNSPFVSFTLPFELFYFMQIPYDNSLLHQDLLQEFEWEFSVLYPFTPVEEIVTQYIEIEKNDFIKQNTAFVSSIPRKYLQMIFNFCESNNLKLKFIDNVHTALERALAASNPLMGRGLVLSIYFNKKYLSIILLFNGKPFYFKVLRLNNAGEIPDLIIKEIELWKTFNVNPKFINTAFISGDETSESTIETLEEIVKIDFIYLNPFAKIKPSNHLLNNEFFSKRYNSFSSAAGIAYRIA